MFVTFAFILDGMHCQCHWVNIVSMCIWCSAANSGAHIHVCKYLIFQMSYLFSKSYLDWVERVGDSGWSVITIAKHEVGLKTYVMGQLEEMRGSLEATVEGRAVLGQDMRLVVLFVWCFVKTLLHNYFQDRFNIGKELFNVSVDHEKVAFVLQTEIVCIVCFHMWFRRWRGGTLMCWVRSWMLTLRLPVIVLRNPSTRWGGIQMRFDIVIV